MAQGLFTNALDKLVAKELPLVLPRGMSRRAGMAWRDSVPSNQQVLDACRAAYTQHLTAVDQTTLGSVASSQSSDLTSTIAAMHNYNWQSKVAAPQLVAPVFASPSMGDARAAVASDGAFATFFLGIQANLDVLIGGEGGVGVGLPFPANPNSAPIWMAYGGFRIALNIDVGININASLFLEPPEEVAGDFLGIELAAEPVAEGPELSLGIHLSPDLSRIRGFSIGVGVALSLLPVTAAIVSGTIVTSAS